MYNKKTLELDESRVFEILSKKIFLSETEGSDGRDLSGHFRRKDRIV